MVGTQTERDLAREFKRHFPERWEVTRLRGKVEGDRAFGAVRIHCLEDDKVFLTDFDARLDQTGKVIGLELDGVKVRK